MAWSWSHTNEAYENAFKNLTEKPKEWLVEVYAEWLTDFGSEDWEVQHIRHTCHGNALSWDVLVDFIWEKAEEKATCDNGGHNAWMCPEGCHTVPFSRG